MVEPRSSNVRVIKTIFLGVRIFRKFTVGTASIADNSKHQIIKLSLYKEVGGDQDKLTWTACPPPDVKVTRMGG